MAWVPVEQGLFKHWKVLNVAAALGIDRWEAGGHIITLWHWALDNVEETGDLGHVVPAAIATAADWGGDVDVFIQALLDVDLLELVDGKYYIHDWHDWGGRYARKLKGDAERKRRQRERERTSGGSHADVTRDERDLDQKKKITTTTAAVVDSHADVTRDNVKSALDLYENHTGRCASQAEIDRLMSLMSEYNEQQVTEAIREAIDVGNWRGGCKYLERILDRWQREGRENGKRSIPTPTPIKKKEPYIPMLGRHPSPGVL